MSCVLTRSVLDRIGREEDLLIEHFGEEFADYERCTWKLIPLVF